MKVRSFMRHAEEFTPVEVELSLLPGLPQISFLGLPDPFIKESVTRIKSALRAQGFDFPKAQQVLVQLRPSHLRKTSRGLDLAVAAALIWETEQAKRPENVNSLSFYGELSLRGEVIVPDDVDDSEEHLREQDVVVTGSQLRDFSGVVWPIKELKDLSGEAQFKKLVREPSKCLRPRPKHSAYSRSQADLISLLAAGGHSALFVGVPGSGKSVTADAVNSFMPVPSPEDWKSIRKAATIFNKRLSWRPSVVVHHSITPLAMTGGGSQIRPGEITRAHGGTLVMDELLEFKTAVQDSIRESLENGKIEIARQGKNVVWPADFQLIATSNLCRCGNYFPKDGTRCRCRKSLLRQYQEKFSGPIIDRFSVIGLFSTKDVGEKKTVSSQQILAGVIKATDTRLQRSQLKMNSRLLEEELFDVLGCDPNLIEIQTRELQSHRTKIQVQQVARTLADLEGSQVVLREHFIRATEFVVNSRKSLLDSLDY